jgi:hypothetical protein
MSFSTYGEFAESMSANSKNARKVFNYKRIWTNGECRVVFGTQISLRISGKYYSYMNNMQKESMHIWRTQKSLSANRNSAIFKINPQIRKNSRKYCTTLSQKSSLETFLCSNLNQSILYALCVRKKSTTVFAYFQKF